MKLALLQMNMKLSKPDENYVIAERLIHHAMEKKPDVLVLPECWNTGFFPKHNLRNLSCDDGDAVKLRIGNLANQYGVNIIAGSVSNIRDDKVYNTAFIFNLRFSRRSGRFLTHVHPKVSGCPAIPQQE